MKTNGESKHQRAVRDINREIERTKSFGRQMILLIVLTGLLITIGVLLLYFGPSVLDWLDKQDPVKTAIGSIGVTTVLGLLLLGRHQISRINWIRLVTLVGVVVVSVVIWYFVFEWIW